MHLPRPPKLGTLRSGSLRQGVTRASAGSSRSRFNTNLPAGWRGPHAFRMSCCFLWERAFGGKAECLPSGSVPSQGRSLLECARNSGSSGSCAVLFVRRYLEFVARTLVLIVSLVATVLLAVTFPMLPIGGEMLDVRQAYDHGEVMAAMEQYGEEGRRVYVWASASLDTLFPIAAFSLLAGLHLPVAPERAPRHSRVRAHRRGPVRLRREYPGHGHARGLSGHRNDPSRRRLHLYTAQVAGHQRELPSCDRTSARLLCSGECCKVHAENPEQGSDVMADLTLVIANKNYSSWSLRPWLDHERARHSLRRAHGEVRLRRLGAQHRAACRRRGSCPVLWEGEPGRGFATFDTIAILERLHELFPAAGIWPKDSSRPLPCSVAGGGVPLRLRDLAQRHAHEHSQFLARQGRLGRSEGRHRSALLALAGDEARAFGARGPFLFGDFTAADAFFAPVASRFATYAVPLEAEALAYQQALLATDGMRKWSDGGPARDGVRANGRALPVTAKLRAFGGKAS